jgi:hypothetical protein
VHVLTDILLTGARWVVEEKYRGLRRLVIAVEVLERIIASGAKLRRKTAQDHFQNEMAAGDESVELGEMLLDNWRESPSGSQFRLANLK